jgi:hypothetical protein
MSEDELAALGAAVEDALFRMHGVVSSCNGVSEAEIIGPDVERIVAARVAEALAPIEALVAGEPGGESQPWIRKSEVRAALSRITRERGAA